MRDAALLRVAAAFTPAAQRCRAAEEWAADLAGCAELGLSPASVGTGALYAAAIARLRFGGAAAARALGALRPLLVGLLFGALCAVADVPVLVVVLVAGGLALPLLLPALRNRSADPRRSRLRAWTR